MINRLSRITFVFYLCFFVIKVNAMDMSFTGSPGEVKSELYRVFEKGMSKDTVLSVVKEKLDLEDRDIKIHDYGNEPLQYTEESGNILQVYSWVEMNIAEYRSIKRMFIKTTVMAKVFFDKESKLNGIEVKLYGDSL